MSRSTFVRRAQVVASAAILGLALASCGEAEDDTTAEPSPTDGASPTETVDENFTNPQCERGQTSEDAFKVGTILPLTGNLAFLGPPEVAGVGLAVSDINAAGGVGDVEGCIQSTDSGDSTDMSVSTRSAGDLVSGRPSVVIGAASSSVTLNVVDTFTDNEIVQISPANTAVDLSGYSDYYFRTSPPDTIQGDALGTQVVADGHTRVAFLVFNDTYGTGLRNFTQEAIEAAGGEVVYGGRGEGNEFPAGQTTFSAEVTAALASNPDAIIVLAFDETKAIIPELVAQGWTMENTYFSDGNTADYSADFDPGTLQGAKGTIPGADPSAEFKGRVSAWHESAEGAALDNYSYAAESYDAVILAALAAVKGGGTDSQTIRDNLHAVSGANGGEECIRYNDCLELLDQGQEIRYAGPSGIGPLNEENDPSSAFIGIYQFNEDNAPELIDTIEGAEE